MYIYTIKYIHIKCISTIFITDMYFYNMHKIYIVNRKYRIPSSSKPIYYIKVIEHYTIILFFLL